MERVKALINKLNDQLDQQSDTQSLLATVQLLQAELLSLHQTTAVPSKPGSSKVSVVMPAGRSVVQAAQPIDASNIEDTPKQENIPEPQVAIPDHANPLQHQNDWLHNLMQEIPTLAHQKEIRELNEVMSLQNGASLNEKLKQTSVEVAEILTREPVRDLKKAIGVNDRFVFVNELFRGDEVMYERSIKTLNSFNVLQEAEFWMERELKLKLGWDENKDTVRHFIQLVRRRFASM
jgi:hypothetical protein